MVIVNNLGLSKIYTIYEHGGLIQSVLHDIRMKIWNFGKDSQRQEIVLKGARWQKIIIQFYLWFFTSMIVLMLMRPIFTITSEGLPFPNSISCKYQGQYIISISSLNLIAYSSLDGQPMEFRFSLFSPSC